MTGDRPQEPMPRSLRLCRKRWCLAVMHGLVTRGKEYHAG